MTAVSSRPSCSGGPDFIGIGAAKAGTTWLVELLRQHPRIFVPEAKELNFFNERQPAFWGVENPVAKRPTQ